MVAAVSQTKDYFAIPYGPSGTAPTDDVRAFELYFERLENAGLGKLKRPDLLLFPNHDKQKVDGLLNDVGGVSELPFTPEDDAAIRGLLDLSLISIECENSLWVAQKMPNFATPLTPQKRLEGQLGLKKTAVTPTVIVKQEDREFLKGWQETHFVPIHVWHTFFDLAFGISLDGIESLIASGEIEETIQTFQAPGGATTKKGIYKVYHHHAYRLGEAVSEPSLVADSITDANGHILPYVRFEGGELRLAESAITLLHKMREARSAT